MPDPRARPQIPPKRSRAERAAQFMPFAALRGYYELLSEQKRVREPRHELTEEEAQSLSRVLASVRRGELVRAVHYDRDAYITTTGCVSRIDLVARELRVIKTVIKLDDLRSLEVLKENEGTAADMDAGGGLPA